MIPAAPVAVTVDPAFEVRWAAWLARGRQRDIADRRTRGIAAIAVAIVVALGATAFLLSGGSL